MIKTKTIFNPLTKQFQKILDSDTLAEKTHNHSITQISGLQTILNTLNDGKSINIQGGYIAE